MDKLDQIFELQKELNRYLGYDLQNLSDDQKITWILNLTLALNQETGELIDTTPWKWWKKHQTLDLANSKKELIDILHFVISLALTLGMTPEELFQMYLEKNQVNHTRKDNNY